MTKTLYDPEVKKKKAIEIAKNLRDILDDETIALKTGLSIEEVKSIREYSVPKTTNQ